MPQFELCSHRDSERICRVQKTAPREATPRLAKKKGRVYHSEEDDGDIRYDSDFQEEIWEDEGHEEETRGFYARARVPGDIICY